MKKIIALSGYKGSGKDEAANYLVKYHGFRRVAFADSLKDSVALEYGISRTDCDDPDRKEAPIAHLPVIPKDDFSLYLCRFLFKEFRTINGHQPMDYHIDASGAFMGFTGRINEQLYWTPRSLSILKGSVNRTVNSDYWIDTVIKTIEDSKREYFVLTDMRYINEADRLREHFGSNLTTARINRFNYVNSTDPSENDLTNYKFDVILDNKGTLEEFHETIRDFAIDFRKL